MIDTISIENNRNLQLSAVVEFPNKETKYPGIILLHGFKGYKEEENIVSLARFLATHGYVTIRFDASGFGESEGTLEKDYRFSHYLDDVQIVYEYLCSLPFVDKERIGIWGHSMGAMLSIIYAAQSKSIKAVCAVSPAIKMATTDLLRDHLDKWKEQGYLETTSSRYGKIRIPVDFIVDAQIYSVLDFVFQLHFPLLLIWGTDDTTVSPQDTQEIFEAANKPKEKMVISGMDHAYKKSKNYIDLVNEKVVEYFNEFLA